MSLEDTYNEVLKKIGRNILLLQQLEHLLKFIIANGNFSGYSSLLKEEYHNQSSPVERQVIRPLVGKYHRGDDQKPEDSKDLPEPPISLNLNVGADRNYYEAKKEVLGQIVSERNELIYNLLPVFDPGSEESCLALQEKLDRQCEKIRFEIKGVESIANALKDGRKKIADFLKTGEGERQFELYYRLSRIGFLLVDIAARIKRTDGWASIATAGKLLKKRVPEELALLKKEDKYRFLKNIIFATGLFDIYEEKAGKGRALIFYRLKQY
ncbi:MAG: hypothetical protein JXL81_11810 [Deltaproteobacteria bacterium]|nr:hypothetical protein [Deltaproteobacteria bacterium]